MPSAATPEVQAMRSELFSQSFRENETSEKYALQSKKMLRTTLDGTSQVVAAAGSMVAYQGDMKFGYKGSGGIGNFLKKAVSGEDAPLMTVSGVGDVFLARSGKEIFTIYLEGESLSVSSHSILAFDSDLNYDIRMMKGLGSMLGAGLFNVSISGHGYLAVVSDGPPLVLDCSQQPTFVDPQAVICWSEGVSPTLKNDINWGSMIGRSSGENITLGFHGRGFVVLQPSEERIASQQVNLNG